MLGDCRCSRRKWSAVCRCLRCLEHAGRGSVFDFLPEHMPRPAYEGLNVPRQPRFMRPSAVAGQADEEDPATQLGEVVLNGRVFQSTLDGKVIGSMSPAHAPRFAGISTFARLAQPHELNPGTEIGIAIVGVPFDSGCSFRPGARFGPESVRANSRLLRPYLIAQQQRPLYERQVVDAGDIAVTPFGIEQAVRECYEGCRDRLKEAKRLVVIGGDHTLSYPVMKAVSEKFGPVVLVHFDAHLDTFPSMYGQDVWHGAPFRNCWKEGIIAKNGSTHVGIRATTYSVQDLIDSDSMGIATLTAEDVHDRGVDACIKIVRERCSLAPGSPVYLSIDIDVLDPSVAPGTGTPEFGGLLAHQLLKFVRGLWGLPIVGADVVEVCPAYDHAGITAIAAANMVLEQVGLISSCMDTDGF